MKQIIIAHTDETDKITHNQWAKSTLIIIMGKHSKNEGTHYMVIKNKWGRKGIMLRMEIKKILNDYLLND